MQSAGQRDEEERLGGREAVVGPADADLPTAGDALVADLGEAVDPLILGVASDAIVLVELVGAIGARVNVDR